VEKSPDAPLPQPQYDSEVAAVNLGEGSGAKAQDPIDLNAPEAENSAAHASRSPPPVSNDFDSVAAKPADADAPGLTTTPEALQPEDAGMMLLLRDGFSCPSYLSCILFAYTSRFRANFSGENSSHPERQIRRRILLKSKWALPLQNQVSHLCWESPVWNFAYRFVFGISTWCLRHVGDAKGYVLIT
jgi:hypothetical protein